MDQRSRRFSSLPTRPRSMVRTDVAAHSLERTHATSFPIGRHYVYRNVKVTIGETDVVITWTEGPQINFMGTEPRLGRVQIPREVWDQLP